jgi:hypothetical protein
MPERVRRPLEEPATSAMVPDDSRKLRIMLLYWDCLGFTLSTTFPSLTALIGKSWEGWYLLMITVPSLIISSLLYGIYTARWLWGVAPALAFTVIIARLVQPALTQCIQHTKPLHIHRLDANSTARTAVHRGIQLGTVYIEQDFFDLFVPPSLLQDDPIDFTLADHSCSKTLRYAKVGLFLFPGALVEHRAYGRVARKLAEERGIMVVVFNLERLHRLSMEFFGCDIHIVKRAISLLERKYCLRAKEWSVGGHSLGALAAQQMVLSTPNFFRTIILWGVYRELIIGAASIDLLVVQASNDALGHPYREGPPRDAFLNSMTAIQGRSRYYDVMGGNHSGFGDYEDQIYPLPDGKRTISLEAMHNEIVDVTASFLLDENTTSNEENKAKQ